MATITKPMALDESFNTTESTSRNQADVLAGIEQAIVRGFGQVANAVSYDNTDSGLTADNVQDAIDEVDDTVDGLVDDVTEISSNIESTQTASGNPLTLTDAAPINAESLVVEFSPKQDLHGQSAPYVGGAGKNKCNESLFNVENSASQYCKFIDGKILFKNTAGTSFYPQIDIPLKAGTYTLSTQNVSGSDTGHIVLAAFVDSVTDYVRLGVDYTFTVSSDSTARVRITTDNTDTSGDCSFNVQIESGSQSTDYAPYENICPITGYTECEVDDVGKNKLNLSDYTGNSYAAYGFATTISGEDVIVTLTNYPMTGATESFEILMNTDAIFDKTGLSIKAFIYSGDNYVSGVRWSNIQSNNNIAIDLKNLSQGLNATITMRIMVYDTNSGEPTAYEPYSSTSATIQFGQTVYGGVSDFVEGGTKDTWAKFDTYSGWYKASTETTVIINSINGKKSGTNQIYCNTYKYVANQGFGVPLGAISDSTNSTYLNYIFINDSRFAGKTVQECQAILESDGMYFVYQVETPTQLSTPPSPLKLLKGTNHITTNGTTINLGYQPDNVIGDVKGKIEKCAVDAEFMQFTDGTDTFTDVNLSLDASFHTVSVVGSKIEQKRFICFEVAEIRSGSVQGIHASCIAFTDGAKTPSGTAFRAYIESLQMYVNFRIYGSGGSYTLAYQSETSFSASAFFVRLRMMNNL